MKLLEQERRRRDLTQTELARILRVHPAYVSHLEAGRWIPSPTSPAARRLARFFRTPLSELLAEVEGDGKIPVAQGARS